MPPVRTLIDRDARCEGTVVLSARRVSSHGRIRLAYMAITTHSVASVTGFIERVLHTQAEWNKEDFEQAGACDELDDWTPGQVWFRGQDNARWKLVPQLYRLKHFNENEIRTEFKLRAFQLMSESRIPQDNREWYFLMQHYGTPTRLLDWTDGALIALYFAVKSQGRYRNSAVWMLDPEWLNELVLKKFDDNYVEGVLLPDWQEAAPWFPEPFDETLHVSQPIAVDPPHIARRVAVQRSRFTIHGRSKRGLDVLVGREPKPRLVKLAIPKRFAGTILNELSTCGIVETSVFPDLDGLSRELKTKWGQQQHEGIPGLGPKKKSRSKSQ